MSGEKSDPIGVERVRRIPAPEGVVAVAATVRMDVATTVDTIVQGVSVVLVGEGCFSHLGKMGPTALEVFRTGRKFMVTFTPLEDAKDGDPSHGV